MKSIREQKRTFWKEHIQKWQESELSQKVYCEAHGLKLHYTD
ncbi:IS66 family insertion sequence element accessory protein TnpA [Legionella longbeachae]